MAVVRDGGEGLEVFCVVRHRASGFLGGAAVFPGGKLDPTDADVDWGARATGLSPRARGAAAPAGAALAFAVAALRELFEEGAILPTARAALATARVRDLRDEWSERKNRETFATFLARHDLILDTRALELLSRWVTPRAESRRYDTRFYVLEAPPGQAGAHDRHETTSSFWGRPRDILRRWESGELMLAPPTSRTLDLLAPATSYSDVAAISRGHPADPVCPHFAADGDETVLALPGDPLYPEPAPAPADLEAPTRFVLEGGRFVARRVTAGGSWRGA